MNLQFHHSLLHAQHRIYLIARERTSVGVSETGIGGTSPRPPLRYPTVSQQRQLAY
ncbi:MAG: hypothetical protein WCB49_13250 [Gammaproteobacteria bacterium]